MKRFGSLFLRFALALVLASPFAPPARATDLLLGVTNGGGGGSGVASSSGPAAPAFTPTDIAGLKLWLKSDTGVTTIPLSASYHTATNKTLSHTSNSTFQTGDIDVTWAFWLKLTDTSGNPTIFGKWATGREYRLSYDTASTTFYWQVSNDNSTAVSCTKLLNPTLNTWYFVVATHNSVTNQITLNFNNGTASTQSHTTGIFSGSEPFFIGGFTGMVDSFGYWKRTLTAAEQTWLYNSGAGREYAELGTAGAGSALGTSLAAWYNLSERSGNRADSLGSNALTSNNSVTSAQGVATDSTAPNGVSVWADQSGRGANFVQTTPPKYPVLNLSQLNSYPAVSMDGIDDFLSTGTVLGMTNQSARTVIIVAKTTNASARQAVFYQGDSADPSFFWGLNISATPKWAIEVPAAPLDSATTPDTSYHQFYVSFANQTATNDVATYTTFRIDKTAKALSGSASFVTLATANITTLGKYPASTSFTGAIDVVEVLAYDTALSSTNRDSVESYLSSKYGL